MSCECNILDVCQKSAKIAYTKNWQKFQLCKNGRQIEGGCSQGFGIVSRVLE